MRSDKLMIIILLLCSPLVRADEYRVSFDSANAAYAKGKYEQAIKMYEDILDKGKESEALYYNLGNAYLKSDKLGKAILNYERAKELDPDDEDINANLKIANQRTEDKIEAAPQLFLAQWENSVTDIMSEKEWSIALIISIICCLFFFILYIFSKNKSLKQIGFFGGATLVVLSVFTFMMAKSKYASTISSSSAVIISPSVTVTGSPNEQGTKLFILHEGTKVKITGKNDDWTEVKIVNGNVGWVKSTSLEEI